MKKEFDKYSGTDGNLSRGELQKLLFDLGIILSHAELEGMFKRLDPDHKGHTLHASAPVSHRPPIAPPPPSQAKPNPSPLAASMH